MGLIFFPFQHIYIYIHFLDIGPGAGRYLTESRVGRCGPAAQALTLFKTRISDFPTLFKAECQFLMPCLFLRSKTFVVA